MTTTAAPTTTISGMDISKHSFELWGADQRGKQTLHKRLHRDKVSLFFANFPRCAVAMEACASSQHRARQLKELGHEVMLIPAQHVIAYRRGGKNDRNDAQAISEAAARPSMRSVPVKTADQQDLQAIHRVRERLIHHRTALINELRGLLMEYGIICAKGRTRLHIWLREAFDACVEPLSPMAQETFRYVMNSARSKNASPPPTSGSNWSSTPTRSASNLPRCPASVLCSPPPSSHQSPSRNASRTDGSSPPPSVWCRASIRPAASPSCSASAKRAIDIYGCCSSTAHAASCSIIVARKMRAASGSRNWSSDAASTKPTSPWRTRTRACCGSYL
jgi:transposase